MAALHQVTSWPVGRVAAAIVTADGDVDSIGDTDHRFRLASLSKCLAGWAIAVAWEEGSVDLDEPIVRDDVPAGATLRHLLAHASGLPFEGDTPIAAVGERRVYSNTGIERAAAVLEDATGLPFATYLAEAVLDPLGMTSSELTGSPAHAVRSTVADMARFVTEMLTPRLIAPETWAEVVRPQFPALAGIVPGVGSFDPCPWGLGVEIKGAKSPHWMGRANSAATFGHFGGAGTMMWADPNADLGVVALTDTSFDQWSIEALRLWPSLSDAALAEHRGAA
ncbi:MAG: beta-lactamase family protein [Ilumatobacter sp.]|nr:beta-lactamase family protein [Ilumatobacter sp.]